MQNKETIRTIFGVTQEEMAMLLGITRSQWSMYELGKRSLPVQAKLTLASLLAQIQKKTSEAKNVLFDETQHLEKIKIIEDLLIINQRKQLMIEKKLKTFEKKQNSKEAALQLANFLKNTATEKTNFESQLANTIETKAHQKIKAKAGQEVFKLQINDELLKAAEKKLKLILTQITH